MTVATMRRLLENNRTILTNASSIIGTFGVSAILGLVFWKVAALFLSPQEVGIGAAAISAMMLLGNFSMLGLGTLLVGEIQRSPERASSLISTSLLVAGGLAFVLGIIFALLTPFIAEELTLFAENPLVSVAFAFGVLLTSALQVLDLSFVGMLRSQLQLTRNTLFALIKLALLPLVGWLSFGLSGGVFIYVAWALGHILSLILLPIFARSKFRPIADYRPNFAYVLELAKTALGHHMLNLALQVTAFSMPVIVTSMISAEANAGFFIAFQIANFLHVVPVSISYALYAVSAGDSSLLAEKSRFTLRLSLGLIAVGVLATLLFAPLVMGFFGESYAENGTFVLRAMAIAAFPMIVRAHYVAINQIYRSLRRAVIVMAMAALLEISFAIGGAYLYGVYGLTIGWVLALYLQVLLTAPLVFRTAFPKQKNDYLSQT